LQSSPSIDVESNQSFVVFEGAGSGLIMPRSETTERMQSVLNRLDETSGRYLVSTGLLQEEEFLDFAERLSDIDLQNFSRTVQALHTPPTQSENSLWRNSAVSSIQGFFKDLLAMDSETLTRVLDKSAELSAPVPAYEPSYTYDSTGKLPTGSDAASPLHNFVRAISTTDSDKMDKQANDLLDGLQLYGYDLQDRLLQIASEDAKIAVDLMASMQDYSSDTQDATFSYLAQLTTTIHPGALPPPKTAADKELGEDGWHGAILGIHAHSKEVVLDMLNTFDLLPASRTTFNLVKSVTIGEDGHEETIHRRADDCHFEGRRSRCSG
jgi:hypothetical protein